MRKTSHILLGLSRLVRETTAQPPITYYALDLEEQELKRTLADIAMSDIGKSLKGKVETKGMWGTYDGGLKFVEQGGLTRRANLSEATLASGYTPRDVSPHSSASSSESDTTEPHTSPPSTPGSSQPPLHILFLGSSLGNFSRSDGAEFLRSLPLRPGSGDTLLIGLDHDNGKTPIEEAYNDRQGYTKRFIMNGLKTAGRALGDENLFDEDKWEYFNQYNETARALSFISSSQTFSLFLF